MSRAAEQPLQQQVARSPSVAAPNSTVAAAGPRPASSSANTSIQGQSSSGHLLISHLRPLRLHLSFELPDLSCLLLQLQLHIAPSAPSAPSAPLIHLAPLFHSRCFRVHREVDQIGHAGELSDASTGFDGIRDEKPKVEEEVHERITGVLRLITCACSRSECTPVIRS